jgi:hypothetical protein
MFFPYTYLKDGSKRDLPHKCNLSCIDCNYLVSFLNSSSNTNILPLTLVSIHFSSQEIVSLKGRSVKVKGLLDSGSLADDFVRYGRYIIVSNRFILVLTTVSSCTVYIIIRISEVE